jgi:cytochrome c nitrite reductase small subunit
VPGSSDNPPAGRGAPRARTRALAVLVVVAAGVLGGVGVATADYAEATSYLSTDPAACANCHIMQAPYDSWQKASHHTVATCVDCHLPADPIGKYVAKTVNGWNHSKAFTLQDFHEPIRITPGNAAILHDNCVRCHADLVHAQTSVFAEDAPRCVRCHATVGHGETLGLGGPLGPLDVPPPDGPLDPGVPAPADRHGGPAIR